MTVRRPTDILRAHDRRCGECGPKPTGLICRACLDRQAREDQGGDWDWY